MFHPSDYAADDQLNPLAGQNTNNKNPSPAAEIQWI